MKSIHGTVSVPSMSAPHARFQLLNLYLEIVCLRRHEGTARSLPHVAASKHPSAMHCSSEPSFSTGPGCVDAAPNTTPCTAGLALMAAVWARLRVASACRSRSRLTLEAVMECTDLEVFGVHRERACQRWRASMPTCSFKPRQACLQNKQSRMQAMARRRSLSAGVRENGLRSARLMRGSLAWPQMRLDFLASSQVLRDTWSTGSRQELNIRVSTKRL